MARRYMGKERGDAEAANHWTRRIQFSGKSSYIIALPKRWVDNMKLNAGSEVTITRYGPSSLIITPKEQAPQPLRSDAVIEASAKDHPHSLIRRIISAYLLGYTIIYVKAKEGKFDLQHKEMVKETVRKSLIGAEVIDESSGHITIQIFLSLPELSVENALRRMFLIAASMHRDAINALSDLDHDMAAGVIKVDDEVDRFSLYTIRQLKLGVSDSRILEKIGLEAPKDCLGYRVIVKSVERVADHAASIAQNTLLLRNKLSEEMLSGIRKLSELAVGFFERSSQALFKRDYEAAEKLILDANVVDEVVKDLQRIIDAESSRGQGYVARLVVEDIKRTAEYATDIAEIVLNLTADKILLPRPTP
ncbi:MAG: phosphate uptake regulator PhoU [Thaumarchaeota archaeon]|nr:phosphate uptake regulator PhoU [Nitrososphaerota archaeon]